MWMARGFIFLVGVGAAEVGFVEEVEAVFAEDGGGGGGLAMKGMGVLLFAAEG